MGPPGDAGPFLGSDEAMPMDVPRVRDQVLGEFPSLQRPQWDAGWDGRFEDLEETPGARLMPPLPPPLLRSGFGASTPISADPPRRHPIESTDLNSIKGPTPTADMSTRKEGSSSQTPSLDPIAASSGPKAGIRNVPQPKVSSVVMSEIAVPGLIENESVPTPVDPAMEHINEIPAPSQPRSPRRPRTKPDQPGAPVESSSTDLSSDVRPRPPSRVRRTVRQVPEYGNSNLVIMFQLSTTFEVADSDNFSIFDTEREKIR